MPGPTALACLLLLTLPVARAADGEDEECARLAVAIRERIEAIERLREEHLAARASERAEAERLEAGIAELTARREQAAEGQTSLGEELARLDADVAAKREAGAAVRARLAALAAGARPVALRMSQRIRGGIPHRREERAAAFEQAAELLAAGDDWRKQADGLRRLWSAVGQELQLAMTREIRTEEVPVGPGRRKHAYVVRFGIVNELFVTEDGEEVGLAARDPEQAWILLTDPEERERVRVVLDSLRKRATPAVQPVPFALEAGR